MANIVIERGKVNTVILTVSTRNNINNPFYLFHFKSKFNYNEERFFVSDNISQNKLRFDEFLITENDSPDSLDGEVSLFTGEWSYDVYESKTKTLDISGTTGNKLISDMAIIIDNNYN